MARSWARTSGSRRTEHPGAPEDALRDALARRRIAVASMWGGWVDRTPEAHRLRYRRPERRLRPLRARIRTAVARLRAARPGITVLLYFDAQRDSSPDAPLRWADSVLVPAERTDWGGRYSPAWGMVPTAANGFGRALPAVVGAMRDLGADGLYWDEMDGVDYREPRLTHATWDGGAACSTTPVEYALPSASRTS
jgi:hypothetical protein